MKRKNSPQSDDPLTTTMMILVYDYCIYCYCPASVTAVIPVTAVGDNCVTAH